MNAGTTNKNSGKTVKVRQIGSPLRRRSYASARR